MQRPATLVTVSTADYRVGDAPGVTTQRSTSPAYWYAVAACFAVAGVIIALTSPLTWLAVVTFGLALLWAALGVRAARSR